MKLSGTAALYAQLKELQGAVAVTQKQIALAEELDEPKPEKKTRRKRTPKTNGADHAEEIKLQVATAKAHLAGYAQGQAHAES